MQKEIFAIRPTGSGNPPPPPSCAEEPQWNKMGQSLPAIMWVFASDRLRLSEGHRDRPLCLRLASPVPVVALLSERWRYLHRGILHNYWMFTEGEVMLPLIKPDHLFNNHCLRHRATAARNSFPYVIRCCFGGF